MSRTPDAIERRELLHGAPSRQTSDPLGVAKVYLEEGRKNEALDFVLKAPEGEGRDALIEQIRQEAVKLGDWFLLRRLDMAKLVKDAHLEEGLDNARKAGRLRYARELAKRLGKDDLAKEIAREINPVAAEPEGDGDGDGDSEDGEAVG